jgi:Rad51
VTCTSFNMARVAQDGAQLMVVMSIDRLTALQISLLVVDSIAFPFRMQQTTYKQQVVLLKMMARLLRKIASAGVAVLLVNQVSGYVQRGHEAVRPALGAPACLHAFMFAGYACQSSYEGQERRPHRSGKPA